MIKFMKSLLLFTALILNSCDSNAQEEAVVEKQEEARSEYFTEARSDSRNIQKLDKRNDNISSSRRNAITNAVDIACPAIVGINVTETRRQQYRDPFAEFFYGRRAKPMYREYDVKSLGSGFLISSDGYILTNHHVAGNATEVVITMTNGEKYEAEIIGADETSDVALLKIEGKDFPYLELSDSDDVLVGEWAIALGNPFGLFDMNAKPTVTVGVVSNTGISFMQESRAYKDMIQTDAAISSGNSGGPLLNANGEVIGMNTVIFSTAQNRQGAGSIGIGFAIPINRVKYILDKIKNEPDASRNYLIGLDVKEVDKRIKNYLNLSTEDGVVVVNVYRNTIADKAGIEPGDVILEVDGKKIIKMEDYYLAVLDSFVGEKLKFRILRGEDIINTNVVLKERKLRR